MVEDGELLMEGEVFQSQPRAVPVAGAEEQENASEDGHRYLHLGSWSTSQGWNVAYAGEGT